MIILGIFMTKMRNKNMNSPMTNATSFPVHASSHFPLVAVLFVNTSVSVVLAERKLYATHVQVSKSGSYRLSVRNSYT